MNPEPLERLEAAVERLLSSLKAERARSRELSIQIADLTARLSREPGHLEELREENRRLRRNAEVAAAKIEELMARL